MSQVQELATVGRYYAAFSEDFQKMDTSREEYLKAFRNAKGGQRTSMLDAARKGLARFAEQGGEMPLTWPSQLKKKKFGEGDDSSKNLLSPKGNGTATEMGEDDTKFIGGFLAKLFDVWTQARSGMSRQEFVNSGIALLDNSGDDAA